MGDLGPGDTTALTSSHVEVGYSRGTPTSRPALPRKPLTRANAATPEPDGKAPQTSLHFELRHATEVLRSGQAYSVLPNGTGLRSAEVPRPST